MATEIKIQGIKQQLREATIEAQNFGAELARISQIEGVDVNEIAKVEANFQAATQRAAELKDTINNVNERIGVLTAGSKFEIMGNSIKDVVGKIASLDFDGAAESAGRLRDVSKQVTFKEAIGGVKSLSSTFLSFGKVLLTNPLFLLTTVITTIISKFDELKNAGGLVGKMFSGIGDGISFVIDKVKQLLDWIGLTDFATEEKAKTTVKNAEKEGNALEKRYDHEIALANAAGKNTTKIELEKEEAVRNSIQSQIAAINSLQKAYGKLTEEQQESLNSLNTALEDSQRRSEIINAKAKKEAEDNQKAINEANQKAAEERIKKKEQELLKLRELENKIYLKQKELQDLVNRDAKIQSQNPQLLDLNSELAPQRQIEDLRIELMEEGINKEIALVDAKYKRLRELAGDDAELQKQIAEKNQAEVEAIEIEKRRNIEDAKIQAASDTFAVLGNLATAFAGKSEKDAKKMFEINKAMSIAQASIDTFKAANSILAAASANPASVLFPGYPAIQAGLVIAAGIANVKKIASQKFNGGGASSASSSGGSAAPATGFGSVGNQQATPSMNLFGQGNQLNNVGGTQNVNPSTLSANINVSVSETEITQKQTFMARVRESSTL